MRLKDYSHETHPELLKGEMFYCNVYNGELPTGDSIDFKVDKNGEARLTSEFEVINFKSKRMGLIAYDTDGNRIGWNTRPVFVSIEEYNKRVNTPSIKLLRFLKIPQLLSPLLTKYWLK